MSSEELLDSIDENNNIIGKNTKAESYKYKIPHRIVHIMVIKDDKIFLPRRALSVKYLPGYYCSSAGGHVQADENVTKAALRELYEEIGLHGPLEALDAFFFTHKFKVHINLYLKEFDALQDEIKINPEEVLSGEFYSVDEIQALDQEKFHPQMIPCLQKTIKTLAHRKSHL